MANYKMTTKELILTSGSSKGSQIKFFKDDYWYKIDEIGPEGKAEGLSSKILACSNLTENEFVKYESCTVEYEGKTFNGCRSKSFIETNERLISFEKAYELMTGESLTEKITSFYSPEERISFVIDAMKEFCGLDVKDYVAKNLTASMVLLDTDRHLNNMAVIVDSTLSSFRVAPIFDNGAAFLSNYAIFPPSISIDDIRNNDVTIVGKPFSADLEYQANICGLGIRFDFNKIKSIIENEKDGRMKQIAELTIEKYAKIPQLQLNSERSVVNQIYSYAKSKGIKPDDKHFADKVASQLKRDLNPKVKEVNDIER